MRPVARAIRYGRLPLILAWLAGAAHGQILTPSGGERSLLASFPGDQVNPAISMGTNGGWLAWEDNAVDRTTLGIAGCRLDSNLTPIGLPFRVNGFLPGDQRQPSVAALPGGGAVFAFHGGTPLPRGRIGAKDGLLRFTDGNGRFLTADLPLSPLPVYKRELVLVDQPSWRRNLFLPTRWRIPRFIQYRRGQTADVRLGVLADGAVLAVYAGVRHAQTNSYQIETRVLVRNTRYGLLFLTNDVLQAVTTGGGWQQDIFFRRFTARGQPLGAEVLVNQSADRNQRHPAVAVLADGRFLVAWVSEEELSGETRAEASVVIKGRFFNAAGVALGDEFQLSASERVCARPALAAREEGGFSAVWNQRDSSRTNNWDVYVRSFDAQGAAMGAAQRVNQHAAGDQIGPVIAGNRLTQLACWTSLRQDGSGSGVFGRVLNADGLAGEEVRINTTAASQQIHPAVAAAAPNRFHVVWGSFTASRGFDLMAQTYVTTQPLPAPPAPTVEPRSDSELLVTWPPVPVLGLQSYQLFMDNAAWPFALLDTQYAAGGLAPGSTHRFRLAYVMEGGVRSLQSAPAAGTTLAAGAAPVVSGGTEAGGTETGGPAVGAGEGSGLRVEARLVGGQVALRWTARAGVRYQVQVSNDLRSWVEWGDPRVAAGSEDLIMVNPKEDFMWFRVVELP